MSGPRASAALKFLFWSCFEFVAVGFATPFDNYSSNCGKPTCSIWIGSVALSYPSSVDLVETTITATVIPVVEVNSNGQQSTVNSTFLQYATDGNNVTWTPPTSSELTWETYGTILTYPTTYVAYPSPSLILISPVATPKVGQPTCTSSTDYPSLATTPIFPSTEANPASDNEIVYSLINSLPEVISLVGGNPQTCFHGSSSPVPSNPPLIAPGVTVAPVTHTSVSVLTKVGQPITLAPNPFGEGGGPDGGGSGGGGSDGSDGSAQEQNQGSTTPSAPGGPGPAIPTPVVVNGATVVGQSSGIVVVNGQTLTPGETTVLSNGAPISVYSTGGVVVVGSSTITAPGPTASGGVGTSAQSGLQGTSGSIATSILSWKVVLIVGVCGVLAML